jgi:hypothetical protein
LERIREAIELAKAKGVALGGMELPRRREVPVHSGDAYARGGDDIAMQATNALHLEDMRVVAHQAANPMTPAFDILRTSVLQLMDSHGWQTLAITSPTPQCGKTVTAINLALSIARMPGRHAVLLDLDMRRPLVGAYLGVSPKGGLFQLLAGEMPARDCMVRLDIAGPQLTVISNRVAVSNPAEVISSKEVADLLTSLKSGSGKPIVVLDTPPMLACDDVLALLPTIDCIAMTVAEKVSKADEVTACERHLKSVNYLGLVLTMSKEAHGHSYY